MRRVAIVLAVIVLAVAAWWGYTNYYGPSAARRAGSATARSAAAQTEVAQTSADLENVIWASGKLLPVTWANLSTAAGGTVSRIHVAAGDWVQTGDVLIELENGVFKSEVERAKASLAQARASQDKLLAGATDAQIAAARAQVAVAQAGVALAEGRLQEVQAAVESAEAQLNIAQQQYNELASHPTAAERKAAEAELAIAQAGVNQAQAAYNLVRGDPNIAARPESMALEQATEAQRAAQAQYELTVQGATPQQLAVAQAQIRAAQAQVTVAQSQLPAAQANVQSAQARVDSAQAALDALLAGPTDEEIAMAAAQVRSAFASLASAHARLRQTQVIAPFDGQVGAIHTHVGELAAAGQPLLLLGDTRQMHVETTDLRETDVVRLSIDMPVEITFDALPDRIFQGTITRIAPVSTAEKGSTNFTVTIDAPDLDESLRWGMTAFINIEVK